MEKYLYNKIIEEKILFPPYYDINEEKKTFKISLKNILYIQKTKSRKDLNDKEYKNYNRGLFTLHHVDNTEEEKQVLEFKFNKDITFDKLLTILNKPFFIHGFKPFIRVKNFIISIFNIQAVTSEKAISLRLKSSSKDKNSNYIDWEIIIGEIKNIEKKKELLNYVNLYNTLLEVKVKFPKNQKFYLNPNTIESITKSETATIIELRENISINGDIISELNWNIKNKSLKEIYVSKIWCDEYHLIETIKQGFGINKIYESLKPIKLIYVSENRIVNLNSIENKKNIIKKNDLIEYVLGNKKITEDIFETYCNYLNGEEIILLLDYLSNKKVLNKILINRINVLMNVMERMKSIAEQNKS
ncbi:hypothetical protein [Flavicella sediminum]|uniref:hypothetical protein n=1 Tax=Flavicella sediminum TaxID=2585141 RepID=UPI00111DE9C1|nr:hypothetical protein [Flavicella sediminum]